MWEARYYSSDACMWFIVGILVYIAVYKLMCVGVRYQQSESGIFLVWFQHDIAF